MTTRYIIETFGCQMNVHDSDRMEETLIAQGYQRAQRLEEADLVVFNTCSVREKAEQKLRSEVGRLKPLKLANPDLVIAVAGCLAQQEGERLLKRIPHLDVVLGPDNLADLPAMYETVRLGGPPVAKTVFDLDEPSFLPVMPKRGGVPGESVPISTFVTTMKGCDERCSFCIVPTTRGPERYRALGELVDEIGRLVQQGVAEITLLGQTVNSWNEAKVGQVADVGKRSDESDFPRLLAEIARQVPNLRRLRYTSPHPRHLTPELIEAHRTLPCLARHVHMPVQSGSDRVLRRMIRRYTRKEYLERVGQLKAACPDLTLATDLIVGFPGETEEDFEETLSLVKEAGFVAAFGFKFSPRPNTPALKLADDVSEEEKSRRLAALFAVVDVQQRAHLERLVGTKATVLLEGFSRPASAKSKDPRELPTFENRVMGRSERNEIVHIDLPPARDGQSLIGTFVEVAIEAANAHSLVGRLKAADADNLPYLGKERSPKQEPRRRLDVVT